MTGKSPGELLAKGAALDDTQAAPIFSTEEPLAIRGHSFRVAGFDEEGMTVKAQLAGERRGQLRMGDFVKLKGFWFQVIQQRLGGEYKLEPWGYPTRAGGPPQKGWRQLRQEHTEKVAAILEHSAAERELEQQLERALGSIGNPFPDFMEYMGRAVEPARKLAAALEAAGSSKARIAVPIQLEHGHELGEALAAFGSGDVFQVQHEGPAVHLGRFADGKMVEPTRLVPGSRLMVLPDSPDSTAGLAKSQERALDPFRGGEL